MKVFFIGIISLALLGIMIAGCPEYTVYYETKVGQARLKVAEFSRRIAIEEAKAKRESSIELAKAEIERAKGVAQANRIIGDSLRDNPEYLKYLWIQGLQDGSSEVIYVPTEATLPILEAGKRGLKQ